MVTIGQYRQVISRLACSFHRAPVGSECGVCHFPVQENEGMLVQFGIADCGEYGVGVICMTCVTVAMTTEPRYVPTTPSKRRRQRFLNWLFRLVSRIGGYDKKWRLLS